MSTVKNYFESIIKNRYGTGAIYKNGRICYPDGTQEDLPPDLTLLAREMEMEETFGLERVKKILLEKVYLIKWLSGNRQTFPTFIKQYENKPIGEILNECSELPKFSKIVAGKIAQLLTYKLKSAFPEKIEMFLEEKIMRECFSTTKEPEDILKTIRKYKRAVRTLEKCPDRSIEIIEVKNILSKEPELYLYPFPIRL
jgi:hypothetical protein